MSRTIHSSLLPGPPAEILPLVQAVPRVWAEDGQNSDSGMACDERVWAPGSVRRIEAGLVCARQALNACTVSLTLRLSIFGGEGSVFGPHLIPSKAHSWLLGIIPGDPL